MVPFLAVLLFPSFSFGADYFIHPNHSSECAIDLAQGPFPLAALESHTQIVLEEGEDRFILLVPPIVAELIGNEVTPSELEQVIVFEEEMELLAEELQNDRGHFFPTPIPENFHWNPITDEPIQVIDGLVYDLSYTKFWASLNLLLPFDAFKRLAEGTNTEMDNLEIAFSFLIFVPATKSINASIARALRGPTSRYILAHALKQRQKLILNLLKRRGIEDIYSPHFLNLDIAQKQSGAFFTSRQLAKKAKAPRLRELGLGTKEEMYEEALRITRSQSPNKLSFRNRRGKTIILDGDTNRMVVMNTRSREIESMFPYETGMAPEGLPTFRDPIERFLVRFLNDRKARPISPAQRGAPVPIQEFILGKGNVLPKPGSTSSLR